MKVCNPLIRVVLTCTLYVVLPTTPSHAEFQVDYILSSEYHPELKDAWILRINNQGVAAGYIATASSEGPFFPTTYSGTGPFQTFGIASQIYQLAVTGIDDRGVTVGNLFDSTFQESPYYYDGSVHFLTVPQGGGGELDGITPGGTAYGSIFDAAFNSNVFTLRNGLVTPLSNPGLPFLFTGERSMNDAGILAVYGFPDDVSPAQNFLVDTKTGVFSSVAIPSGYASVVINQVAGSGIILGTAYTTDNSRSELFLFNADGTIRGPLAAPSGTQSIVFNNVGHAAGINLGQIALFDGTTWTSQDVLGLNGYTLGLLSDFNDSSQVVGLLYNPDRSFLWGFEARAVPEPSSLVLVLVSGFSLVVLARLRGRGPGQSRD